MLSLALLFTQAYESGATLRIYSAERPLLELPSLVPGQTPNVDLKIPAIDLGEGSFGGFNDGFYAEVTGELLAKETGDYTFGLECDDGAALDIDGKTILSDDGVHPARLLTKPVSLTGGWHPFKIRYFEKDGQEKLRVSWTQPGETQAQTLGGDAIRVPANLTRVVAPGFKRFRGLGGPIRPGSGEPLRGAHPGVVITTIRPEGFEPKVGSMAFVGDRLIIGTFDPNQSGEYLADRRDGTMWALDGVTTGDRKKVRITKLADNMQEPLGMVVVNGDLYVSERDKVERFRFGPDGKIALRETAAKGWQATNYHHFDFGLAESGGKIYGALSTSISGGYVGINGPNPPHRGSVYRFDPKTGEVEWLTSGHRTPNGMAVGPDGTVFVGENQGAWQPANKINAVIPGGFYGHYNFVGDGGVPGDFQDRPLVQPALFLPQNDIANSPSQPVFVPNGPYKGQMLIPDVKYGGLSRAFLEKVDGQWQGGATMFSQGFESGLNRAVWGPDGNLYVGGIGATETWAWTDPATGKETKFGLQQVRFTGKRPFEIHDVSATPKGFRVRFSEPVDPKTARNPESWRIRQWHYEPTPEYGGPKIDQQTLTPSEIVIGRDGKTMMLTIPGLKARQVVALDMAGLRSRKGQELWATECWYTLNVIPGGNPNPVRVLAYSRTTGFRHDSIPEALQALKEMKGLTVEATEDPAAFTPANLKRFDVVAFVNTTGDVLDDAGQSALEGFVKGGGGWIGVHSASDTEYGWPFYKDLVGALFDSHPPGVHKAKVTVEDRGHLTTTFLPPSWERTDEWYDFKTNPRATTHVLATIDESTYTGGKMGKDHPIAWCHEVGQGRSWYTAFGHTKESWSEPLVLEMVRQGVLWAAKR